MALSRGLNSTLKTELAKPVFFPVVFLDLDWPSGRIRAHSRRGTITWGGNDWTGVGDFAAINLPGDSAGFAAQSGTIQVVGAFNDVIDAAEEQVKGRRFTAWWGVTTTREGTTLAGDPFPRFYGAMDGTKFRSASGQYGLQLTVKSGASARLAARLAHSAADQSAEFPGDTAGRHTALAAPNAQKIRWPA